MSGYGFADRSQPTPAPQAPKMTYKQMLEVINSVKPGDRLRIVFADEEFDGDLKGRVYHILAMCAPVGRAIDIGELPMFNLQAVADSGRWIGFRTYVATILDGFDPRHFVSRTIGHDMLESINRIDGPLI